MPRFGNKEKGSVVTPEMLEAVRRAAEDDTMSASQQPALPPQEIIYPPLPNRSDTQARNSRKKKSKPAGGKQTSIVKPTSTDMLPAGLVREDELEAIVTARLTLESAAPRGRMAAAAAGYGQYGGGPDYSLPGHTGLQNADHNKSAKKREN